MSVVERVRGALRGWRGSVDAVAVEGARKTAGARLPAVLSPWRPGVAAVPKPTPANLRLQWQEFLVRVLASA